MKKCKTCGYRMKQNRQGEFVHAVTGEAKCPKLKPALPMFPEHGKIV